MSQPLHKLHNNSVVVVTVPDGTQQLFLDPRALSSGGSAKVILVQVGPRGE